MEGSQLMWLSKSGKTVCRLEPCFKIFLFSDNHSVFSIENLEDKMYTAPKLLKILTLKDNQLTLQRYF